MFRKAFSGAAGLVATSNASADWSFNMPSDMAALSAETYDLHANIMYGCFLIAALVFAAMIVALVRHRRSGVSHRASSEHSMTAEMIWTTIPIVIVLAMVVPSAEAVIKHGGLADPAMTSNVIEYECRPWSETSETTSVSAKSRTKGSQAPALC
jgi:cytochrome c oxidase subunit 2